MTVEQISAAFAAMKTDLIADHHRAGSSESTLDATAAIMAVAEIVVVDIHRAADALELIAERLQPEVISREETFEEKIARLGMTRHDGDLMPVTHVKRVEVLLREGAIRIGHADTFWWGHSFGAGDIVAYRVVT